MSRSWSDEGPDRGVSAEPDFALLRERMVAEQLVARDIVHPDVLEVMRTLPRHEFVPADRRHEAYEDGPVPIGFGQTVSQPYMVAFMTQALCPGKEDVVLEVGTGSGYQTAVLAKLVRQVHTIEIIEPLARSAEALLSRSGIYNFQIHFGDGYQGWPPAAPFDAIIVTCAPDQIPPPLVAQLKSGGRMIIPAGATASQVLYLLVKEGETLRQQAVMPVRFVEMTRPFPIYPPAD